jgi:anthranilate synthase/aminodeoxychorismate synthase-like glutamine amidotransferase
MQEDLNSVTRDSGPKTHDEAPKVLVIDNYDSFTYNLVQYLGELGADLIVRRNDEITVGEIGELVLDRIVISPGPGVPENAGISISVIEEFSGKIPVLGVCLGHQAIAAAFGGTIELARELKHGKTSWIYHEQDSILSDLEVPFEATRYHSLIVSRDDLPSCLLVNAWTEDGLVMGIRHRDVDVFGVQFHPESIMTNEGKNLLRNFLCCKSLKSS